LGDWSSDRQGSMLRRDFPFGSGVAHAAGALAAPAPVAGTLTPMATRSYAASTGHLLYDSGLGQGCQGCLAACPQRPHRPLWNPAKSKSAKRNLCADPPFRSQADGPAGHRAWAETCAVKALKLVTERAAQLDCRLRHQPGSDAGKTRAKTGSQAGRRKGEQK